MRLFGKDRQVSLFPLAVRWAMDLGYRVKPGPPNFELVRIGLALFLRGFGTDQVWVFFYYPIEVLKEALSLGQVDPKKGPEHMGTIEALLGWNPRNAHATEPDGVSDLFQLKSVAISQTVRITKNDPSTFNRFADALREVESGGAKVQLFLRTLSYVSPKAPDAAMREAKDWSGMYG